MTVLWRTLINKSGGRISESMDLSSLAKITDGYTPGHMAQALQQVLTERRIQQVQAILISIRKSKYNTKYKSYSFSLRSYPNALW